ncbi:GNAT family N-acetyltransferase [Actinomyces culturomici]|uniref:GNAT family N-acetyltransferase n=1 Tax=Actinomyces culturomici TaxID=1926276 RepID=UPI000E200B4D|nr:GNAT family N-acetyltransferase [Actinomyces culturomici]
MDHRKLRAVPVPFFGRTSRAVRRLYLRSFPKAEQLPLPLLHAISLRRSCHFLAWFEEGASAPCALSYAYVIQDLAYIGFLAVDQTLRSRGVGTRILQEFQRRYPDKVHVLEIEPVEEDAENAEQRLKRLAFYERNGFTPTNLTTHQFGEDYTVLTRNGSVAPERLEHVLDNFGFGLVRTTVTVDD